MIIGITGGSGSGKTTLLKRIAQAGGLILDCDEIYHDLLKTDEALLERIGETFPGTVQQGQLDRKALGSIVFSDPEKLKMLNSITHSAVYAAVVKALEGKPQLAAIDAIGLFEGKLDALCDITVAVTAPWDDRIARLMKREGISREYAAKRLAAQHSDGWFREKCEACLENNGTLDAFATKCVAFLAELGIIVETPLEEEKMK